MPDIIPVPTFEGRIGLTLAPSEPSFEMPPHPGEDAPNVVLVLLGDAAAPATNRLQYSTRTAPRPSIEPWVSPTPGRGR